MLRGIYLARKTSENSIHDSGGDSTGRVYRFVPPLLDWPMKLVGSKYGFSKLHKSQRLKLLSTDSQKIYGFLTSGSRKCWGGGVIISRISQTSSTLIVT